jgi:hypothetical protein
MGARGSRYIGILRGRRGQAAKTKLLQYLQVGETHMFLNKGVESVQTS